MRVEQAVFGEMRRGHALRASSGEAWFAELAHRLDLPDTAPPGVDWAPFVSGFPHRDRYVVARTLPDPSATRSGMVLTHALIVPLAEIVAVADLRPLFGRLITEPVEPPVQDGFDFDPGDVVPPSSPDLPAAVAALANSGEGPVVHLGSDGFEVLVAALWGRLWPELRRVFAFRLSFGPPDVVTVPSPTLVCTPASLAGRWRDGRVLAVPSAVPPSPLVGLICGTGDGPAAREFVESIGARLDSFGDLRLMEAAYRLAMREEGTFADAVSVARLAQRLSPDPARGARGKAALVERVVDRFRHAMAEDVLRLRNLDLPGFEAVDHIWAELERWLAGNRFAAGDDKSLRVAVTDAVRADACVEAWREAVLLGLTRATRARGSAVAAAVWRWAEDEPFIVEHVWSAVGVDAAFADCLASAAPQSLSPASAEPLLRLAARDGLYVLHGVTVAAAFEPHEAVRRQIDVEPPSFMEGVRRAVSRASPEVLVGCALGADDPRVIAIAAEHVANVPRLLAGADLSTSTARSLWAEALARSADAWMGPDDPRAAFDRALNDVLDGVAVPPRLVEQLALTPLADLTGFSRRAQVWSTVSGRARDGLLTATARRVLRDAVDGGSIPGLERELERAVLSESGLDDLLRDDSALGRGRVLRLVVALPGFPEHRLQHWLRSITYRTHSLTREEWEAIGRLAEQRQWRALVRDLVNLHRRRGEARHALLECASMLGWVDRMLLRLAPDGSKDQWDAFAEVAASLLPGGPEENDIWERAGGHNADLHRSGDGRQRWRNALRLVRNGGKGPSAARLLSEFRKDFPHHDQLRLLAELPEFGTRAGPLITGADE